MLNTGQIFLLQYPEGACFGIQNINTLIRTCPYFAFAGIHWIPRLLFKEYLFGFVVVRNNRQEGTSPSIL
jgi:hypothetical protein